MKSCVNCGASLAEGQAARCAACAPQGPAVKPALGLPEISPAMHARLFFMTLGMISGAAIGAAIGYFFGMQTTALFDHHHFETPGLMSYLFPAIRQGLFSGALIGLIAGEYFCKSKRSLGLKIIGSSCVASVAIVAVTATLAQLQYAGRDFSEASRMGLPAAAAAAAAVG